MEKSISKIFINFPSSIISAVIFQKEKVNNNKIFAKIPMGIFSFKAGPYFIRLFHQKVFYYYIQIIYFLKSKTIILN